MEENLNNKMFLKKYLPTIGLAGLTILLMLYFKYNSNDNILHQGANAIMDFYTSNLRPLFYKTDISEKDVFNFAVNRTLPIDRPNNKYLLTGDTEKGDLFYQVKTLPAYKGNNSYDVYLKYFDLNEDEQEEFNELLAQYRSELYSLILYNEYNTFAVSEDIELLRNVILTDIVRFLKEKKQGSEQDKIFKQFPKIAQYYPALNADYIKAAKSSEDKLIFFGPDTIFTNTFAIDRKSLKNKIVKAENNKSSDTEEYSELNFKLNSIPENTGEYKNELSNLEFSLTENKVTIPKSIVFTQSIIEKLEVLENVEEITNELFIGFDDENLFSIRFNVKEGDSVKNFNLEFNLNNLPPDLNSDDWNFESWEEFKKFGIPHPPATDKPQKLNKSTKVGAEAKASAKSGSSASSSSKVE